LALLLLATRRRGFSRRRRRARLPLLVAAAWIGWDAGEVVRHGRSFLLSRGVMAAEKAGAGSLEFLWTAVTSRAGIGKNLRRSLAGVQVLGIGWRTQESCQHGNYPGRDRSGARPKACRPNCRRSAGGRPLHEIFFRMSTRSGCS
jgi:hypothetical protein